MHRYWRHFFALALMVGTAVSGCRSQVSNIARAATGQLAAPTGTTRNEPFSPPGAEAIAETPTLPAGADPLPDPTREEAFAKILGDLQALGAENPEAQRALLQQLQSAQPAHWALLVERTRIDDAYRKQIANVQNHNDALPASMERPLGSKESSATPSVSPVQIEDSSSDPLMRPLPAISDSPSEPSPPPSSVEAALQSTPLAPSKPDNAIQLASAIELSTSSVPEKLKTDWRTRLQDARDQLAATISDRPANSQQAYDLVRLRLLHLAAGNLDAAVQPVSGLSSKEQDFWSKQMFAIGTMLDGAATTDANHRATGSSIHLNEAHQRLGEIANLVVRNPTFCKEVHGYGAYKPRDKVGFHPGEQATLYVEIENFSSFPSDKGFRTSLATSYRVLDEQGERIEGGDFPAVEDHCLSRRRDFHIQYGVTLPRGIALGRYQLELTVTDRLGDKIGHGTVDFEIVIR